MLAEPVNQSPKPGRVTRRTSLRQSLNLASMSKALADVISKDKATKDTKSKKNKESRRVSAVNLSKPSTSRSSMGDTRSPSQNTTRTATPDSRKSTRRRVPGSMPQASLEEQPQKPIEPTNNASQGVLTRAAALRAKSMNSASTSLPKYRPKTSPVEQSKPSPVPVRAGTRRRLSNSDDEPATESASAISSSEKGTRAISPLPQRAALKALNTTNTTPSPPTLTKGQKNTPSPGRPSPTRPTKTFKTSNAASSASRPSSSASSSSVSPTNSKTPVVKPSFKRITRDKNRSRNATPTVSTPQPDSPSPITRHARSSSKPDSHYIGNMSHISELADEDEDEEEDVELLLAPVAALGAPTPAMPRIQKQRPAKDIVPMTPIRDQLPSRANMSYLSPLPHGDVSGSSLRPTQPTSLGNNSRATGRGSILSWEQLASEASKTLGEDEIDKMLADIPAPFRSEVTSPALSANLEIPESPCLNAIDSPSGYGSISQVLLPDVTPSPALPPPHRFSLTPTERDSIDSSTVTMLKLQLAKAESIAKERLQRMQAMEEEIHFLRETQSRQNQEIANHVTNLETFERAGEERMAYAASLEDQLRRTEIYQQQAVEDAIRRTEYNMRTTLEIELKKERLVSETSCAARMASSGWLNVKELSEVELDLVRGDRAALSVLLAELDKLTREVSL